MSALAGVDVNGQRCIQISLPQGDRATVSLYGAQVLSWQTANGREHFYLSPKAIRDGSSAVRGGVPICFPQFNQRALNGLALPKHGFARNQVWAATRVDQSAAHAEAVFALTSNTQTLAMWPHHFKATLTVSLSPGRLRITFDVANTGHAPWPFALALHSYLAVADARQASVSGLAGQVYWDGVKNRQQPLARDVQPAGALAFDGETDRVYENIANPLELGHAGGRLRITQSASLPDAVVWNPGAALGATLADMPTDGWQRMVCVEAARINQPHLLAPGESWAGWQQLEPL